MQQEIEGRLIGQVIKIDEAPISYHLGKVVRETVEETLNAILLLVTGSLRRVYVPDTAITRFAVAIAISWSLDYGLLRVERAFNEDSFRAGLEAQVREQETSVNDYVNVLMRGYESSFLAAARAVLKEQD